MVIPGNSLSLLNHYTIEKSITPPTHVTALMEDGVGKGGSALAAATAICATKCVNSCQDSALQDHRANLKGSAFTAFKRNSASVHFFLCRLEIGDESYWNRLAAPGKPAVQVGWNVSIRLCQPRHYVCGIAM